MDKEKDPAEAPTRRYYSKNSYAGINPFIVRIVRTTAARAIGKAGYMEHDLPDIEQELMTAAVIGLRDCNPGGLIPINLVRCIVDRHLYGLLRRRLSPGGDWHRRCISLNEKVCFDEGESVELLEFVDTHHELLFGILPQCCPPVADFCMDIEYLCSHLTPLQRRACELLRKHPRREVAKKLKVPRSFIDACAGKLAGILREWRNFR
jgi:hypothetical protein